MHGEARDHHRRAAAGGIEAAHAPSQLGEYADFAEDAAREVKALGLRARDFLDALPVEFFSRRKSHAFCRERHLDHREAQVSRNRGCGVALLSSLQERLYLVMGEDY